MARTTRLNTRREPVRSSSPRDLFEREKPFNPLAASDRDPFRALLAGEHVIHGFTDRDLRAALYPAARGEDRLRVRAQVSRMLSRLHAYHLVAKIPRSHRWKVSAAGHRLMSASLKLRDVELPLHHDNAA